MRTLLPRRNITTHRSSLFGAAALAFLALCFFSTAASAQGGSMELTVVDEDGKKLKDVSVKGMAEGSTDVVTTATTNKKGVAKAEFPAAGFYALELSADGYPAQTSRVEIREAMNTTVSVTLFDEATLHQQQAVDAFNAGVAKIQGVGQEAEALADFVKAAEMNPQLADAHRLVAIIAAQMGDLDVAGKALDSYLELVPEGLPQVATAAYTVYRKSGRTSELPAVREALKTSPAVGDVAIAVFNEGVTALKDAGDDEDEKAAKTAEAKALFSEAIALDPKLSVAHRSLAALEFNQGNYEAALPSLEKLLAISPTHRDGNRMAFFSHASMGHKAEAAAAGKAWADKDPNAAEEISAKAAEFYELNDSGQAMMFAELALAANADSPYANYTMGRVLAGAGQIAKAKEHLQRFIELAPNHPEAASAKAMLSGL